MWLWNDTLAIDATRDELESVLPELASSFDTEFEELEEPRHHTVLESAEEFREYLIKETDMIVEHDPSYWNK